MNLLTVFLTGLLTGGLTCLAVQGGLLAATIAQREEDKLKNEANVSHAIPIISFLAAKLIAYTILGVCLGWLGSFFQISVTTRIILNTAVIIFMVGTGLNLLNVHPIFRYFVIQPPRFLTRFIRNQSKSRDIFAPAILGAFTIFIPCGTTQAIMAFAIASGNPLNGAMIMFSFVLGTTPLFFILAYLATRVGGVMNERFTKVAAIAVITIALYNLGGVMVLSGLDLAIKSQLTGIYCTFAFCSEPRGQITDLAVQEAALTIDASGYTPKNITIKSGSQITLHVSNNGGGGCAQSFTIPELGIQKVIPVGQTDTIVFNAPNKPGKLAFMCSMGMYRGYFTLI
jgi:sulfite exporter TauE/SafE